MLKRFFPVYIGIGILFFAVLLSVPVLYESLSLIKNGLYSTNNDDYEHFIWGGAPWYSYLIGFIFPKVSGTWNFFEPVQSAKYFYVSSVIGVFFLFALLQKFKYKTFWCGSFAFVYLWLLGDVFFLSQFVTGVLFKIPVLQLSHWVVKHFLEYSFLLSVVGSFGIHSYLSQTQNYPPRWFVSFVSVIVLLLLIGIFKGFISSKDFILADALYFLPALLPFIPYQYTLTRKISLGLLFILLFAYSFPFLYKFEFFDRPEEKNLLMIDSLKMQEGNDRSLAITKNFFWLLNDTTLRGLNVGTASHKPSMNQRSIFPNPIGLILYGSVNNSLFGIFGDDSWEKRKKLFNRRFLNLLGVRYLYIAKDSMLEFENFGRGKEDRWEVLEATNWGVKLENADFKGLIFSPKTVQKDSRPNLIEKLIADERIEDLMDNAYVNKIPNSLTNNIVKTHSISNFNGKIEIKATCTRPPCFLTMSYWYYPGWFLKINGIKKDLYNVDGFLMGAFLDSGKNYIILEYRPFLKIVYWILWSIFLILLVLYLFLSLFKLAHSRP